MAEFVLSAPLDTSLIRAFDAATTACFEYGSMLPSHHDQEERSNLDAVANRLGHRLLGSRELLHAVYETLGEGPAAGDVLGALDVLYESGRLDVESVDLMIQLKPELVSHRR
jgi:hypothetical protein